MQKHPLIVVEQNQNPTLELTKQSEKAWNLMGKLNSIILMKKYVKSVKIFDSKFGKV